MIHKDRKAGAKSGVGARLKKYFEENKKKLPAKGNVFLNQDTNSQTIP